MKFSFESILIFLIASFSVNIFSADNQKKNQKMMFERYYNKSPQVSLFSNCSSIWHEWVGGSRRQLSSRFKELYGELSLDEVIYEKKDIFIFNPDSNKFEKHKLELAFAQSRYGFPISCFKNSKKEIEGIIGHNITREIPYGYKDIFEGKKPELGSLVSFTSAKNENEYDVFEYDLNGKKQVIFIDYQARAGYGGYIFLKSNIKSKAHKQLFSACTSIKSASDRMTGMVITDQDDGYIGCIFREQHESVSGLLITRKYGISLPIDLNGDGYLDIEIINIEKNESEKVFWMSNKDGTYSKLYGNLGRMVKSSMDK